jgi:hypothetical protein
LRPLASNECTSNRLRYKGYFHLFHPYTRRGAFDTLTSLQLVKFDRAQGQRQQDGGRRCLEVLALLDAGLPLAQFLGGLALVAAEFANSETTPGSMRVISRSAFLPL